MKFSRIFKIFLLLDLDLLLLLLSCKNVTIAAAVNGVERNAVSMAVKATLDNSGAANDVSPPPPPPAETNSSLFSHLAPILLILGVIAFVVLLFFFLIYYKKYINLKEYLKKNNVILTDDHVHDDDDIQRKLNYSKDDDEEKNTEIVIVRDPHPHPHHHHNHNHNHNHNLQNGQEQEEDKRGDLVFMNPGASSSSSENHLFELDDLLKASAEGLGKGNFGNCYRAMMETGPTVVVKRLRDLKPLSKDEFVKMLRGIAELKHPNLLPLLGYYYSKDEKLLLYKYASHGNAHNRLHDGRGKPTRAPFRWSSRLAVARGVAGALEYLHLKSPNIIPHGNLKLSNVLLDENDGVLVTDYGLTSLVASSLASQRMVAFKSPEFQNHKRVSRKSDVRSYGCLLLELLTGRLSSDSAPQQQGLNNNNNNAVVELCSWVHRAVREEWTAEIFDVEIAAQRGANAGMLKLLQIAIRCCERSPEMRPEMSEVVREVGKIEIVAVDSGDEEFSSMDRSITDESTMSATPSRSIG